MIHQAPDLAAWSQISTRCQILEPECSTNQHFICHLERIRWDRSVSDCQKMQEIKCFLFKANNSRTNCHRKLVIQNVSKYMRWNAKYFEDESISVFASHLAVSIPKTGQGMSYTGLYFCVWVTSTLCLVCAFPPPDKRISSFCD